MLKNEMTGQLTVFSTKIPRGGLDFFEIGGRKQSPMVFWPDCFSREVVVWELNVERTW